MILDRLMLELKSISSVTGLPSLRIPAVRNTVRANMHQNPQACRRLAKYRVYQRGVAVSFLQDLHEVLQAALEASTVADLPWVGSQWRFPTSSSQNQN